MEVLLKLRELGYPLNLAEAVKSGLKCNNKEADRMVGVSLQIIGGSSDLYFLCMCIASYSVRNYLTGGSKLTQW